MAEMENQTDGLPPGYPKLAEQMSFFPEKAIFRRFGFLNNLNILYLQAELMDIEDQLRTMQRADSKKIGPERYYAIDWDFLQRGDSAQLKLVLQAREKLDQYNTALLQQSRLLHLKFPARSDLSYLQRYLASRHMGPRALDGLDSEVWGTDRSPHGHSPDIVALLPRKRRDMFSHLLTERGASAWFRFGLDRLSKPSPVHGMVAYEESTLHRLTYLVATALASLLPIVSIVVLYFVGSMEARLGIIAAFNVLTSFCLAFFTAAKRTDIFAVAAAFSALQVVFVQGGGGGTSCG
ncbi:hypothetical protein BKCO1_4700067 [Neofusicoccum parvum]|uniref:Uncharacterized protein n=1 Tax=Neofusicoccum parvum TaxID=310453 RepID=A0ACB5S858_9PEZI|nr:hypothetical protein BKCO1_4700067 [Neofusicoccum parvum]